MSQRPVYLLTHPRSCSTAFERVFMTRRDTLSCVHEPFGDAFYFGPERLIERYEENEAERKASGFSQSTYKTVFDRLDRAATEGMRLFIKDMASYLVPPDGKPAMIAPSLAKIKRGVGTDAELVNGSTASVASEALYPFQTDAEPNNPTVVPEAILKQFHCTFLIRHPRSSVPSYYRCTVQPLAEVTGFYNFMPKEAGYDELRRLFDYLRLVGQIGPKIAGQNGVKTTANGEPQTNGRTDHVEICVIDADDLLDHPAEIVEAYCKSTGIEYSPGMLKWNTEEDHRQARAAFEKWTGFHDDAMDSSELKPRLHRKVKSDEEQNTEWLAKFGETGAKIIRETVDANIPHYEYLKQFAIKV